MKHEVQQAFDQIPYLESVYNDLAQKILGGLLAIPFNLWLLEKDSSRPHRMNTRF